MANHRRTPKPANTPANMAGKRPKTGAQGSELTAYAGDLALSDFRGLTSPWPSLTRSDRDPETVLGVDWAGSSERHFHDADSL